MTDTIQRTIIFVFSNSFTKQKVLTVTMPYIPFKATIGYYSRMYKRLKAAAPHKFDKSLLASRVYFKTDKDTRTVMEWPNGMKLDMPHDVTVKEVGIIKHQLEGIKMSLK